jgi:orotate phosphoribosyltransferase
MALEVAGAYQSGHFISRRSGLHSDKKIAVGEIVHYPESLDVVRYHLSIAVMGLQADVLGLYVPVPDGATSILDGWESAGETVYPAKLADRKFDFSETDAGMLRSAQRAAIIEDAVTTGATAAAMAEQVHAINSDLELDLVGIVLRGAVLARHAQHFRGQSFLLRKAVTSWPIEECTNPACGPGAA